MHVLDAYHGHGVIWDKVIQRLKPDGWDVRLFRVDKEARGPGTLKVDNARLLPSLDLARFDLIDLDAYGWPVAQLAAIHDQGATPMVCSTRVMVNAKFNIPQRVLDDLGVDFPKGVPPQIVSRLTADAWDAWLHHLGWRLSLRYDRRSDGGGSKCYELLLPPDIDPARVVSLDTFD